MSRQVIILDEAEEELSEAHAWYEERRAGLGREFMRKSPSLLPASRLPASA